MIGFLLFTLGPMLASFYLGFTQYSIASPPRFVGLANYEKALLGTNSLFWPSLGRTFLIEEARSVLAQLEAPIASKEVTLDSRIDEIEKQPQAVLERPRAD